MASIHTALSDPPLDHAAPTRLAVRPSAVSCSTCSIRHACVPASLKPAYLPLLDELTRIKRRVIEGALLCRQGESFSALYVVRTGALKTTRRWQSLCRVIAFHFPGDVLGLEAIAHGAHSHDVWALEDSEICVIPYAQLMAAATDAPVLHRRLIDMLSTNVLAYQDTTVALGNMAADQRIAWFLLTLSGRYKRLGYAAERFNLHMRQADIASYLGLTYETVSRVMAQLRKRGLIATGEGRWRFPDVELKDVDALKRLTGGLN